MTGADRSGSGGGEMLATAMALVGLMALLFGFGYYRLKKRADEPLHEDHG